MSDVKKMTVKEFREQGYLQELNRQLLHPLGLALEIIVNEDGSERFGEVWDSRDDPEGFRFGDDMLDSQKAGRIANEQLVKATYRKNKLGYVIQPTVPRR